MREEIYKGYKIRSTPNKLTEEEQGEFSVNGIIVLDRGCETVCIVPLNLRIPDAELVHETIEEADNVFVKFARNYIDAL